MSKIVTVLNKTKSTKVGDVAVTYAPTQSCPTTCRFLNNGCYAQNGNCGYTTRRISKTAEGYTSKSIALEEAEIILNLPGDKPLRLHISGDCKTPEAAKILSIAAKEYTSKFNQPVWTYTHSWKIIPRKNWGEISIFASCETFEEVEYANKRGYAAAMTRYKPFNKKFKYDNYWMIPCTEQTTGKTCNKCRLCFNDDLFLASKSIICFFSHGSQKEKINTILKKL